jgi:hypothetical protein
LIESATMQTIGETQIFNRVEIIFDAIGMTQVTHFAVVCLADTANRLTMPTHLPFLWPGKAGKQAQQAGFALAIATLHQQQFAGLEAEVHALE